MKTEFNLSDTENTKIIEIQHKLNEKLIEHNVPIKRISNYHKHITVAELTNNYDLIYTDLLKQVDVIHNLCKESNFEINNEFDVNKQMKKYDRIISKICDSIIPLFHLMLIDNIETDDVFMHSVNDDYINHISKYVTNDLIDLTKELYTIRYNKTNVVQLYRSYKIIAYTCLYIAYKITDDNNEVVEACLNRLDSYCNKYKQATN